MLRTYHKPTGEVTDWIPDAVFTREEYAIAHMGVAAAKTGLNNPGGFVQTRDGFEIHDSVGFVRLSVHRLKLKNSD